MPGIWSFIVIRRLGFSHLIVSEILILAILVGLAPVMLQSDVGIF